MLRTAAYQKDCKKIYGSNGNTCTYTVQCTLCFGSTKGSIYNVAWYVRRQYKLCPASLLDLLLDCTFGKFHEFIFEAETWESGHRDPSGGTNFLTLTIQSCLKSYKFYQRRKKIANHQTINNVPTFSCSRVVVYVLWCFDPKQSKHARKLRGVLFARYTNWIVFLDQRLICFSIV